MSGSVPSLFWTIILVVIVLVVIIVLLKVVFAIIAIGPLAYAQSQSLAEPGAPIDYGPNGIPILVWPDGIANGPPTAPNLQDVVGLIPGGPAWGF